MKFINLIIKIIYEAINILVYIYNRLRWYNPVPPSTIIYIHPDEIIKSMEFSLLHKRGAWRLSGIIKGGDWDQVLKRSRKPRITKSLKVSSPQKEFVESFYAHIVHDVPITETSWYNDQIKKTGSSVVVNKQSVKIIKKIRTLYNDIKKKGFHTSNSLFSSIEPFPVSIGRNGEFIYMTGKHRYTIAKILADEDESFKMPVRVALRHAKWQAYRDDVTKKYIRKSLKHINPNQDCHPDLYDILGTKSSK